MLSVGDFQKLKFIHQYHNTDVNFDSLKKGKDVRVIILWQSTDEHIYDIPITWIVRNNQTIYKGNIETVEELKIILKTLDL